MSLASVLDPARCEHLAPVSPAQLRVLLLLQAKPWLNVNGLADALQVGASSASRLCDRLEARVLRPVFYQLVEFGEENGEQFGVWSSGRFFPLGRLDPAA